MKKSNSGKYPKRIDQLSFDNLFVDEISMEKQEKVVARPENFKNEKFPISIVIDFNEILTYIAEHAVQLTKTKGYISRKHLPAINDRMSVKADGATSYTEQDYYPYIHFLFHLAISARLVEGVPAKSGQFHLGETERVKLYWELTDAEKYFFILETFWVDVDWAKVQWKFSNTVALQLNGIFSRLRHYRPGQSWNTKDPSTEIGQMLKRIRFDWNYFPLYFEWLGFWVCEEDVELKEQRRTKSDYYTSKITITSFGVFMIPILLFSRNIEAWNIGVRREGGEFIAIPGSSLERVFALDLTDEEFDILEKNIDEDQSNQPFFQPFTDLFSKDELQHTLPRNRQKFADGLYTFKVSLGRGIWRKVALSATHTMDNLHAIILRAFQFDDDHLYSFFMDGRKWSNNCIASPYDNTGHPDASKIQIGSTGFVPKQTFLYLFDYGDEWTFTVEVERIDEHAEGADSPFVKESKGTAPDQYMDFY